MKKLLLLSALAAVSMLGAAETKTLFPGKEWRTEHASIENNLARISVKDPSKSGKIDFWIKVFKGEKLTFKAIVRGENISPKNKSFEGVRLTLWGMVKGKSTTFGEFPELKGTFGWTTVTKTIDIPENFDGWLLVGLTGVTGELFVKEVTATVEKSNAN